MHAGMSQRAAVTAALSLLACHPTDPTPDAAPPNIDSAAPATEHKDIPITASRDLDLLFVIDDSPSMADKQANLRANFPNLVARLENVPGGLPNLHLGVVSTDLGTKGAADAAPGPQIGNGQGACIGEGKAGNLLVNGAPVQGAFLTDVQAADGSRARNYTGTLADVFATIVGNAGTAGCGFEQPLEAVHRALDNNAANAGFLRPSALLAVVILTDEDDCSFAHSSLLGPDTTSLGALQSFRCTRFGITCDGGGATTDAMNEVGAKTSCHSNETSPFVTQVQGYVDFLHGLKANPADVVVAAIAGDPAPVAVELRAPPGGGTGLPALAHSCAYTDGNGGLEVADPAVRIQQFLAGFPDRSSLTTVCQQDQSSSLQQIADLITTNLGSACFANPLADIDPATPGPQYSCTVADVTAEGTPSEQRTPVAACDASTSNRPCWRVVTDTANCQAGDHLALEVVRDGAAPPDLHVVADCVIP
jgi:hypothetical protein